jgi:hypothetical protein
LKQERNKKRRALLLTFQEQRVGADLKESSRHGNPLRSLRHAAISSSTFSPHQTLSLPRSIDRQGSYIRKLEEGKSSRNKRREKQTKNTRGGRAHPNEQRKLQALQLQIVVQRKKKPRKFLCLNSGTPIIKP